MNPESRMVLPPIAFRSFAQSYITPELAEGFADITTINFEVSEPIIATYVEKAC